MEYAVEVYNHNSGQIDWSSKAIFRFSARSYMILQRFNEATDVIVKRVSNYRDMIEVESEDKIFFIEELQQKSK